MELSPTSAGDAERQTSTSFLEKLGDMRPDGEKNMLNNTNVPTRIFQHLSFGQNEEELVSIEVNQKVKAVVAIKQEQL